MELFWQSVVKKHLQLHEVVILYGNIYDLFPAVEENSVHLEKLIENLADDLGYRETQVLNALTGNIEPVTLDTQAVRQGRTNRISSNAPPDPFMRMQCDHEQHPTCWIIRHTVSAFPRVADWDFPHWAKHQSLIEKIRLSQGKHRFVILFPDEGRIPGNFLLGQPNTIRYSIPLSATYDRRRWVDQHLRGLLVDEDRDIDERPKFVALTEGLHWKDLHELNKACHREDITDSKKILSFVRTFKFGDSRDYWAELLQNPQHLLNAEQDFIAGDNPIRGQNEAVKKSLQVITKACYNLSKIVSPSYNRPRGILFFVGPTGVGKTMLAKKLAKHIFGDEQSCMVFDMSEYSQPHSGEKLIGAPPGYVGHDQGGQLTGKIRQKPFSVVLFDEIDKAHPAILTNFLQILDEGRLTDGKGQTCYFSETLIIFTSNYGTKDHAQYKTLPYDGLQNYYRKQLSEAPGLRSHPEIINRIGLPNIIPFNELKKDHHVLAEIEKLLDKTTDQLFQMDFDLSIADETAVCEYIADLSHVETYGMRNIKQVFEAEVLEKITEVLLQNHDKYPLQLEIHAKKIRIWIDKE